MAFCLVYVTHENEDHAKRLSDMIVGEKLAACANLFPITSAYWWKQEVTRENEWVSILKTIPEHWLTIQQRISELHPYEVPCIMRIDVQANEAYESWIRESVAVP